MTILVWQNVEEWMARQISIPCAEQNITMIVAEFSLLPMGSGTSAGDYIRAVHALLEEEEIRFIPGAMSTSLEVSSLRELFDLMEKANHLLAQMGVRRIITSIRIDMRLDREITLQSKLSRLQPQAGDSACTDGVGEKTLSQS